MNEVLETMTDDLAKKIADYLVKKLNESNKNDGNDEFLTVDEVAKFIGYQKSSIYGLVKKNKIPYHKKGKLFFLKSEIIDWLKEGKKTTSNEIKNRADQYLLENGII